MALSQTQRELLEEARKALRADREKADVLDGLVKHPGWPVFAQLINDLAQSKGSDFFRAIGPNEALSQEFNKGTINGLLMTLTLPHLIIQHMTSVKQPDDGDA